MPGVTIAPWLGEPLARTEFSMSKLPPAYRFLDLSDYGRPVAVGLVRALQGTRVTSIHLTWAFFVAGAGSILAILSGNFILAAGLLMVKNILDAADGEMARVRSRPSHTGRYLDSVFDYVINAGIVGALAVVTGGPVVVAALAFLAMEFQGTIYNHYYLIQRRLVGGDTTSRVDEFQRPHAFPYESPRTVAVLHRLYVLCYGPFDRLMLAMDRGDDIQSPLPNAFLTALSTMGLGAQLLVIAVGLVLPVTGYVLPLLGLYTGFGLAIIAYRKYSLGAKAEAGCTG